MILDQAIKEVQQICGWRSGLTAEITLALKYSQDEREKPGITFPWWLLKEDVALPPLTIGSQTLALPIDFIQESEEDSANLRYNSGVPNVRTFFLKKGDYETLEKYYFGTWDSTYDTDGNQVFNVVSPGVPKAYCLRMNAIRLYPAPDQAYVLTWSYWGKDTTQQLGQENAWLKNAPWVLIGDAAKKIGSDLGNSNAVATAGAVLQRAESDLFRSVIARADVGRVRSMGSRL